MKGFLLVIISIIICGCKGKSNQQNKSEMDSHSANNQRYKPKLLLRLPDSCNTPDGLTAFNGDTALLSTPNFIDIHSTPAIYKIAYNFIERFIDLPVHPITKHVCPMDLAFGPDGNLYINDNQYELYDKNYQSRLLKVIMKQGKPQKVVTIVSGFKLPNGMVWKGDHLYITDSEWSLPGDDTKSAIFHFTLSQLSGKQIRLKPGYSNEYLLDTFTTHMGPDKIDNGVDGIDFDSKGNLYTGLFGDGIMYKIKLKHDGSFERKEVFVPAGAISSVDGFIVDRTTDVIYVADAKRNAIKVITPAGKVTTLWANGDTNGEEGLLDQPAEVLLINKKLYITNFDKANGGSFVNQQHNLPNTISVINLK